MLCVRVRVVRARERRDETVNTSAKSVVYDAANYRRDGMEQMIYRQGDVLVIRVDERPAGEWEPVERAPQGVVLAYGEVTGHAHAIKSRAAKLYRRKVTQAMRDEATVLVADALLEAAAPIVLRHEEHGPIHLDAGRYVVRQQIEYAPAALRTVVD